MTKEIFTTETSLIAEATLKNGKLVKVRLITKVGRAHYYSALNEIGITAEEKWELYEK